jgi:hypothetical protein
MNMSRFKKLEDAKSSDPFSALSEMLYHTADFLPEKDRENAVRLLKKYGKCSLTRKIEKAAQEREVAYGKLDQAAAEEILSGAMTELLWEYPVSIDFKKKLWDLFEQWAVVIEKESGLHVELPKAPVLDTEESKLICLVKALHGPDGLGCTRKSLEETLSVNEKSVRTYLARLSDPSANNKTPWYLGGQLVSTPVKERADQDNGHKKYVYTPDTLHPLVLQMNITQVAFLLKSLGIAYFSGACGHELSLDLAYGVWSQLSEYGKARIRKAFTGDERVTRLWSGNREQEKAEAEQLEKFLDLLAAREDQWVDEFFTETELLASFSDEFDVMLILKGGRGLDHPYTIQCRNSVFANSCIYMDFRDDNHCYRIVDWEIVKKIGQDAVLKQHKGVAVEPKDLVKIQVSQ